MSYTYDRPHPSVTVDIALFAVYDHSVEVLLIQRGHEPFKGRWALPGGRVDENEDLDAAALRELEEETGLTDVALHQVCAIGTPGRDPRGHTVSILYVGQIDRARKVTAQDDAVDHKWHPRYRWDKEGDTLAFDHSVLIAKAYDFFCANPDL